MRTSTTILLLGVVAAGFALHASGDDKGTKKVDTRVFELRTYYPPEGKMDALHARFRDHTCKLFEKHGMTLVGFWIPNKSEDSEKKLVYMLAFPSKEAAAKSWKEFGADPEWIAAKKESEKNGPLVSRYESVYLNPTDYSPMK
jgi:hypothetical protein